MDDPIGLYVHIPFCERKCAYCDFNTYARLEGLIPSYLAALKTEITCWGNALARPKVQTVFFGGGTPSWLAEEALPALMDTIREALDLAADAEVTAEANPGDVNPAKMAQWKEAGINRVSMGVQSFDDALLRLLTRRHSANEATEAFRVLENAGFDSVSFDLMYGLPTQSRETWRETLKQAAHLSPPHISLYALTVEEATPLWADVHSGAVPEPDPDLAGEMYELAEETLAAAGYAHYEISNWAMPHHESRHNLIYWRNEPFLGVGPGGHSYLGRARFWNIKSPSEYVKRLEGQGPLAVSPVVAERQPVTDAQEISETLILRLRLDEGVGTTWLLEQYGEKNVARHLNTLKEFHGLELLEFQAGVFRLTSKGRLLSNELFLRLLSD